MTAGRLPTNLRPKHYDLAYRKINFQTFTFDGTVAIECDVTAATSSIVVHAIELQLLKATLRSGDNATEAVEFRYKTSDQTCEMIFTESILNEGQSVVVTIDFMGTLNNQMHGLYRSTYQGLDGKSHIMATTQFEATDARRAFPCLDEPALKATFCVAVTVPAELQCISNTPVASTHTTYENGVATKTVTFQKTPKMSTYLLALVVGQFDGISATSNQIVTTVYTVPGKALQGQFCLDTAVRCLDLYQQLFQIPYPLVKSDLLAIPDFAAGAMENWGCVTYREAKILVKPGETSETTRRGIARTVCHELAHQWFGNLVTMEFWTQLWLNEGFARFMEFVACDDLFPDWQIWTEFVQSVYGLAMSLDSMTTSHPVEVEVTYPDEINDIFDAISYAKGASIIRMIASHIGMDKFFDGVRLYLSRHAYGNAVTNDIWGALEEASGSPVTSFMTPWTLEVGFPLVSLGENDSIAVCRFMADGPNGGETLTKWPIPVTALVEGLDGIQGPWVLNGPSSDDTAVLQAKIAEWSAVGKWFKLNVDQTGFYRVAYSSKQLKRLSAVMDPTGPFSVTDRLGLISDAFATGKAGYGSVKEALRFVAGFGEHESADYGVWEELADNMASLTSLFRSDSFFPDLQRFVKQLFARQLDRLGWEASPDESARIGSMRATVIGMMGAAGDSTVLEEAFNRFIAYRKDPVRSPLAGDLKQVVFRCALRHDEETVFSSLQELYEEGKVLPEEQRDALSVMGCVKDATRHRQMLDYLLFSGKVRLQDLAFPMSALASTTDEGGLAAWNFFKENYTQLKSMLVHGPMWAPLVGLCCRGITTEESVEDVARFFAEPSHAPETAQRRLQQSQEVVSIRMKRRERDRSSVEQFLQEIYH